MKSGTVKFTSLGALWKRLNGRRKVIHPRKNRSPAAFWFHGWFRLQCWWWGWNRTISRILHLSILDRVNWSIFFSLQGKKKTDQKLYKKLVFFVCTEPLSNAQQISTQSVNILVEPQLNLVWFIWIYLIPRCKCPFHWNLLVKRNIQWRFRDEVYYVMRIIVMCKYMYKEREEERMMIESSTDAMKAVCWRCNNICVWKTINVALTQFLYKIFGSGYPFILTVPSLIKIICFIRIDIVH